MTDVVDAILPPQPELVPSEDDDDDEEEEEEIHPMKQSFLDQHSALSYLVRYETMIRQQEAENLATLSHVRVCLDRLEEIGSNNNESRRRDCLIDDDDDSIMQREISYHTLQQALTALEQDSSNEPLSTDRQFMLVLRSCIVGQNSSESSSLTWAELYQCYKSVIAGMQTLQMLPPSTAARQRARDRSLQIVSLFGNTNNNDDDIQTTKEEVSESAAAAETSSSVKDNVLMMDEESSQPNNANNNGHGLFWLFCFAFFLFGGVVLSVVNPMNNMSELAPTKAEFKSATCVMMEDVFVKKEPSMKKKTVQEPPPPPSIAVVVSSSMMQQQPVVATTTTTPRSPTHRNNNNTKKTTTSLLLVRATITGATPFLLKGILMLPSPLQSLSILTIGGLSVVASVSNVLRWFLETKH